MAMRRERGGFTLIELLVVISIIALLIGILLPALGTARKQAQVLVTSANMRSLGQMNATYASGNDDLIMSFTWKPGKMPTVTAENLDLAMACAALDPRANGANGVAATLQELAIFRQLNPRQELSDADPIPNHSPFADFTPIVGASFLDSNLPMESFISPADRTRAAWQNDKDGFLDAWLDGGSQDFFPAPPEPPAGFSGTRGQYRWLFSSSFKTTLASVSNDVGQGVGTTTCYTVPELATSRTYRIEGFRSGIGTRQMNEVIAPSGKVHMYDNYDRYSGNQYIYSGFDEARVPLLFFDGSVNRLRTGDANLGWRPNNPTFGELDPINRDPEAPGFGNYPSFNFVFDDAFDNSGRRAGRVYYRFNGTRWGLSGVDYGGARRIESGRAEAADSRTCP